MTRLHIGLLALLAALALATSAQAQTPQQRPAPTCQPPQRSWFTDWFRSWFTSHQNDWWEHRTTGDDRGTSHSVPELGETGWMLTTGMFVLVGLGIVRKIKR